MQATRGTTHRLVPKCPQTSLLDLTEFPPPPPPSQTCGLSGLPAPLLSPPLLLANSSLPSKPRPNIAWSGQPAPSPRQQQPQRPPLYFSPPGPEIRSPKPMTLQEVGPSPPLCAQPLSWHLVPFTSNKCQVPVC